MVGAEGCGGISGDVVEGAFPGLWAEEVVFVACWPGVGANLWELLLLPCLWEAESML